MSLPYDFQSKIGYNSLIQNVILKELNNIMGTIITDLDVEKKRKIIELNILKVNNCYVILFNINDYYICNRK